MAREAAGGGGPGQRREERLPTSSSRRRGETVAEATVGGVPGRAVVGVSASRASRRGAIPPPAEKDSGILSSSKSVHSGRQ